MNIFNWYISRRNSILKGISNKKDLLSSEWGNFLKKETYLTSDLKEKFQRDYSQLFHWFFLISKKVRISKREYDPFLYKLRKEVYHYNEQFIERRLKEYKTFFDGKQYNLKPLDYLQRKAIIIDDKHNLIIAGAGAGKTAVLTSKITYLINRQDKPKIKPEKILVLAFNNMAVDEIKKRMRDNFQIEGVNITNFHKLGCHIIHNETKIYPSLFEDANDEKIRMRLRLILNELLKKEEYQNLFLEYLSDHLDDDVTFEDKEEYYNYMRDKRYTTLKNEKVKSHAEREIANFFFTHNIQYEYEKEIDWIKNNKQEYCPDFYLPEFDVYLEHWGLDRDNKVPEWFDGENPSEKYLKNKEWKLEQFKIYGKKLVQSWSYEKEEGTLISNLMKNLKKISKDIQFDRLSYGEIIEKTHSYKENSQEVLEMISSFINIAKSNDIDVAEIKKRTLSNQYLERQKLFGKIAVEVFSEYDNLLDRERKIDFNDMMIKATSLIKQNSQNYKDKYDYILVDEFQDISKPRLNMIQALLNCNPNTKLLCVGDDWQSINGFAGSEVDYFINFKNQFKYCEEIPLKTNYRSSEMVVEMSNQLISKNKNRTEKEIVHFEKNSIGCKAQVYVLPESSIKDDRYRIEKAIEIIRSLFERGVDAKDILVLSRFNKILRNLKMHCHHSNPKIPIFDKDERTRGITCCTVHKSKGLEARYVIILDVISGTYGFPSEIKDSSVLEIAKNNKNRDPFEEERRLFYVALTRSKEFIHIFTIKNNQSIFLKEISSFIEEKI